MAGFTQEKVNYIITYFLSPYCLSWMEMNVFFYNGQNFASLQGLFKGLKSVFIIHTRDYYGQCNQKVDLNHASSFYGTEN